MYFVVVVFLIFSCFVHNVFLLSKRYIFVFYKHYAEINEAILTEHVYKREIYNIVFCLHIYR